MGPRAAGSGGREGEREDEPPSDLGRRPRVIWQFFFDSRVETSSPVVLKLLVELRARLHSQP